MQSSTYRLHFISPLPSTLRQPSPIPIPLPPFYVAFHGRCFAISDFVCAKAARASFNFNARKTRPVANAIPPTTSQFFKPTSYTSPSWITRPDNLFPFPEMYCNYCRRRDGSNNRMPSNKETRERGSHRFLGTFLQRFFGRREVIKVGFPN